MSKNYFAIVHQESGKLLLKDGRLPIYWRKDVAREEAKDYPGYIVQLVDITQLEKLILSKPNSKAR